MNLYAAFVTVPALLALCRLAAPIPRQQSIYAPAENLEYVDVALINTARQEIDFAAYVLTDRPVVQALTRAADRGVKVRIYLDGARAAEVRLDLYYLSSQCLERVE